MVVNLLCVYSAVFIPNGFSPLACRRCDTSIGTTTWKTVARWNAFSAWWQRILGVSTNMWRFPNTS